MYRDSRCLRFTTHSGRKKKERGKRNSGGRDNLPRDYCHNGRHRGPFTLADPEIHSKCNKRSDYRRYDRVPLDKGAFATRIENDTEIALVDIDLDGVNTICAKKKKELWKIISASILFAEIMARRIGVGARGVGFEKFSRSVI